MGCFYLGDGFNGNVQNYIFCRDVINNNQIKRAHLFIKTTTTLIKRFEEKRICHMKNNTKQKTLENFLGQ